MALENPNPDLSSMSINSGAVSTSDKPGFDSFLIHRSFREHPEFAQSAMGGTIRLQGGRTILDACGGAAVSVIGQGNTEVIAAITNQLQTLAYTHTMAYTTAPAEELAELLVGKRPGGLSKAYFVGSGSEAIDSAMKLARQFYFEKGEAEREFFIARKQSYHGNCLGSMSLSGNAARRVPYESILLPNVGRVGPCYAYQYKLDGESNEVYVERLLAEVDAEFQRLGPGKVIAFVAETMGGATAACILPLPGYFAGIRKICSKYGALLILDEVMCGVGRTGTFFAWEQEDIVPDIMTIGKGLGGGYIPISAVLAHEDVIAVFEKGTGAFVHGHTFQAHPVACAGALAVQKILKRNGLIQQCKQRGALLQALLRKELGDASFVGEIRGRGLFWGIEFVKDRLTKEPFDHQLRFGFAVQKAAFSLGIAVYPGAGTIDGIMGDHVILAPPFSVTETELETIVQTLKKAYEQVATSITGRC